MLYEIAAAPSSANSVIVLHASDNVAIARVTLPAGQEVQSSAFTVLTRDAIPAGHKVALQRIAPGDAVVRDS